MSSRSITPEQELDVLKLILKLRELGDVGASERLRNGVRKVLLQSKEDEEAMSEVDELIRKGKKTQSKLDGSYEARRERKRLKRAEMQDRASRFIDNTAEEGSDDESDGDVEDEELGQENNDENV
ncbi:hypothetical protein STCU_02552 [Strigomonas culicis]|uniref:Uncharacterized protein n=1 Tax=Strigomonas culicis TaxID=28005 RepID=S9URA2_9TRYP|nr:hypothetical protein STCU_03510 [Strigomonas culicis]EPY32973.1 hypothetical protein STCU_02552 [Strigomonas culicis]|eukprot:EPY31329.1 hypothetical protein STCU_03510 [Strigomonas culicis]